MPIGGSALDLTGVSLPEETLSGAKKSDAILLGAIGGYKWDTTPKHLKPETGLLQLRAGLEVFSNLRPATVLPQLVHASTLKKEVAEGVDIMVGTYWRDIFWNLRGFSTNEQGHEIGFNTEIYADYEIDRIARVAFEIARQRGSKLCSVDKANVLEASMLWRRRVEAIALEYPDVKLSHMYVDNAAMQLLCDPKQFDTIVTNNIFGDILSDEASMVSGSIGMLPSASPSDSGPAVYEPIHGSAPDIACQDKANPLATILSAAMLLRYGLQESEAAERIENAATLHLVESRSMREESDNMEAAGVGDGVNSETAVVEENGEVRDLESNCLRELLLLKRHRTLSSSPLAMVGAKVAHIESLDYEMNENDLFKQDWSSRKKIQVVQYMILKWKMAFLIGLLTGLIATLVNLAVENIAVYKLPLVSNCIQSERRICVSGGREFHAEANGDGALTASTLPTSTEFPRWLSRFVCLLGPLLSKFSSYLTLI
ncbi:LOW QUALITY PROTEIN: hypothetical protein V2J09_001331 [Rumex salicifolius]